MFIRVLRLSVLACLLAAPAARAQFAVIDVAAITQLIEEVQALENQLDVAREHLAQAQAEYASITGSRGMERLLAGAPRNYLPADWTGLQSAMQGGGGFGALSAGVVNTVASDAVLSPLQLAVFPPELQQRIDTGRRLAALHQNVEREALATTSNRFASLQQLISAIPTAVDQKAVLELQARAGAEVTMLQNETTKLQTLDQVIQAEERANALQIRELAVAGHGMFDSRFEPTP
jgi:type IV secretion system protein VirB5